MNNLYYKWFRLMFFFLLFSLFILISPVASAEGTIPEHVQSLNIIKYGLKSGQNFSEQQTTNDGLKINNIVVDDYQKYLKPLAGVSYKIQKATPVNSQIPIELAKQETYKEEGMPALITTNQSGEAEIELQDGFYIVSEQQNLSVGLKEPALPILLRLPVINPENSGYLDQVYIYPKSSIDASNSRNDDIKTENTSHGVTQNSENMEESHKKLPDTGGRGESFLSLLVLIFLSIVFLLKKKKEVDYD